MARCIAPSANLDVAAASYIRQHPGEALQAAQAGPASVKTIASVIHCGQYGAAAGHLLVDFVATIGPGKLGDALKAEDAVAAADRAAEAAVAEQAAARPLTELAAYCFCFPAGTSVATPRGPVLAEDSRSGTAELARVQAVIADGIKPLLAVELSDGSAIKMTANHPFCVDRGSP